MAVSNRVMEITGRKQWREAVGGVRRKYGPAEMMKENEMEDAGTRRRLKNRRVTNCRLSLRDMNRVLIDPETEAIIPAQ